MAEMRAAGASPAQTPSDRAGAGASMTRAEAAARSGDAVVELPPLIEFAAVDALGDRRPPAAPGQRPVRRRFLAPLSAAAPAAPPPFHEPRAEIGARAQQLLLPVEPQPQPAGR